MKAAPDPFVKKIVKVEPEDIGWYRVTLECGHVSSWIIKPKLGEGFCAECLNDFVDKQREKNKGAA